MIEDGCVIISQHSDTTGPAVACEEMSQTDKYEVYHVGYNQGMTSVAPTTSLIGCKVNWEPYESAVIQAVLDGKRLKVNWMYKKKRMMRGADLQTIGYKCWS